MRNSDTPFLITDCSVAPVNEVCLLANCSAPQLFGPDGENGAGGQHLPLAVHGVQDLCGVHGPLWRGENTCVTVYSLALSVVLASFVRLGRWYQCRNVPKKQFFPILGFFIVIPRPSVIFSTKLMRQYILYSVSRTRCCFVIVVIVAITHSVLACVVYQLVDGSAAVARELLRPQSQGGNCVCVCKHVCVVYVRMRRLMKSVVQLNEDVKVLLVQWSPWWKTTFGSHNSWDHFSGEKKNLSLFHVTGVPHQKLLIHVLWTL